ncbi:Uncharacterised protein [Actinobacillus pleuropneumoniae]|nr:Uncharacterised protein [Actinobacillus pleuropneumoniae]
MILVMVPAPVAKVVVTISLDSSGLLYNSSSFNAIRPDWLAPSWTFNLILENRVSGNSTDLISFAPVFRSQVRLILVRRGIHPEPLLYSRSNFVIPHSCPYLVFNFNWLAMSVCSPKSSVISFGNDAVVTVSHDVSYSLSMICSIGPEEDDSNVVLAAACVARLSTGVLAGRFGTITIGSGIFPAGGTLPSYSWAPISGAPLYVGLPK